jgi:hypothetical protein
MSILIDHQTGTLDDLQDWISKLPRSISYDEESGGVTRQEFLEQVSGLTEPSAIILIYLHDYEGPLGSLLTLSYLTPRTLPDITKIPKRINLLHSEAHDGGIPIEPRGLGFDLFLERNSHLYNPPYLYILPGGKKEAISKRAPVLMQDDIGLMVIFLSKASRPSDHLALQYEIVRRFFATDVARARHERLATALSKMLALIATSGSTSDLCILLNDHCRSNRVFLFERRGNFYEAVAGTTKFRKTRIPVDEFLPAGDDSGVVRSHLYDGKLSNSLANLAGRRPWMFVPCLTDAIEISSLSKTRCPQFALFFCGKVKKWYVRDDFSLTDASIARSSADLLSKYLPNIHQTERTNRISRLIGSQTAGEFDLGWLYRVIKLFVPGLHSIGVYPEFPRDDDAEFKPSPFYLDSTSISKGMQDHDRRSNGAGMARSANSSAVDLNCLIVPINIQFRGLQCVVFAFQDKFIPDSQQQLLSLFIEFVHSEFSVIDFREYHLVTQAQIRHVIRGSLTAAMSEFDLIASRVRLYAGMPTKLVKLFKTHTMADSMADALLWMNEAYNLADAPRYLFAGFDKNSVRWSDVDPAAIVRSTLAINRGEIRRRRLRVIMAVDPKMEGRTISTDAEFLKIVIFNLIDNAVKYSFQDGRLRIELIYKEPGRWRFEVENMGVPIDLADREKIFAPWVRAFRQYLASRRPGTGLGLAVSRRILSALDDEMVFNFTSSLISQKLPPTALTCFFFELSAKGKGEAAERADHSL